MSFIKFFWKDLKSDHSYNWFAILCAALGIIGLLLVESFKVGVEEKVSKNARNFIASDLAITTRRNFSELEKQKIENYLKTHQYTYAEWIETYSLIGKADSSAPEARLANLNFISPLFPFYGGVTLENAPSQSTNQWNSLHAAALAWISQDLSWQLNLIKGDSIKVGNTQFLIDGIIIEDNFSSFRGFALAPKVFLSLNFLNQAELIKEGSTASFTYAIKINDEEALKTARATLRKLLPDRAIKILGPEESSQQISRSLVILGDYLSLITLMTYLLSLIGLYYFTQHYLSEKLKTFSIYKAMGLKTTFLFKVNLAHLIFLTGVAVIISCTLVILSLPGLESFFSRLAGEDLTFKLSLISFLRIFALAITGSLLCLGPLIWGALQSPVAAVFSDLPSELKRVKLYYYLPLLLYVIVLTILLANSFKVGSYFLISLLIIISLAGVIFKIITLFFEKMADRLSFSHRHALKSLGRYFTSSFTIFICLVLGLTLTTFIFQLEHSLRKEFTQTFENKRPDLFMFDLQDEQSNSFLTLAQKEQWQLTMYSPMVRARFLKINEGEVQVSEPSREASFTTREDEASERMRNRGVNLSYRSKLSWSERIVAGTFNGSVCNPDIKICEISLEKGYAGRIGAKLGDVLYFDVSGIEIKGIVTSMRAVKWTSFEPNFFILFQPGILEDAPKTFLTSIKVKSLDEKKKIYATVAKNFSNVSILEVSEILKKITTIFDLMAVAIKFIAFLSLFVAVVVLIAVSFNHLDLRKKEMSLFYLMGLKKAKIKAIYNSEFITLIILCTFLSLIFGTLMTSVMMKFIFDSEAILRLPFIGGILTILAVVLAVIVRLRVSRLVNQKNIF